MNSYQSNVIATVKSECTLTDFGIRVNFLESAQALSLQARLFQAITIHRDKDLTFSGASSGGVKMLSIDIVSKLSSQNKYPMSSSV